LLLRLGESATLTGLAKYGLEPLPVRLVINKPPVPAVPQIINNTTAIRIEGVDQNLTWYKLSLRNLSSKNITGLVLSMPSSDGSSSQFEFGTSKHPVIAAGDLHQMILACRRQMPLRRRRSSMPQPHLTTAHSKGQRRRRLGWWASGWGRPCRSVEQGH